MALYKKVTVFVLFAAVTVCGVRCLRPGEPCTRDNKTGTCSPIVECTEVIAAKQNENTPLPPPCYVSPSSVPHVCCLSTPTTNTPTPKAPGSSANPVNSQRSNRTERISRQKCREYAEFVYTEEPVTSLISIEGAVKKVDHCVKYQESLIVVAGGDPARLAEFPHMALLGYGSDPEDLSYDCGGSLISEEYVLTAAHCLLIRIPSFVLLGELILGDETDMAKTQLIPVGESIFHPSTKFPSRYFDILLIRLQHKARLGPEVRPACLHTGDPLPPHGLVATGWGLTEYAGSRSDSLMAVKLNVIDDKVCRRTYQMESYLEQGVLTDQQMCAGYLPGGKDTCQGDSGGPLQVYRADPHCTYDIVAVTSVGKGCALRNTPGLYSRVQYYVDWIESVVWPPAAT